MGYEIGVVNMKQKEKHKRQYLDQHHNEINALFAYDLDKLQQDFADDVNI